MTVNARVKSGGPSQPTTFSLRLTYWSLPSTTANMAWGIDPPACKEIELKILGVLSARGVKMNIQAVFPVTPMPPMNSSAKTNFIKAVREIASMELKMPVDGVTRDIVDWDGTWGYL